MQSEAVTFHLERFIGQFKSPFMVGPSYVRVRHRVDQHHGEIYGFALEFATFI